jgi:hypothetical protein
MKIHYGVGRPKLEEEAFPPASVGRDKGKYHAVVLLQYWSLQVEPSAAIHIVTLAAPLVVGLGRQSVRHVKYSAVGTAATNLEENNCIATRQIDRVYQRQFGDVDAGLFDASQRYAITGPVASTLQVFGNVGDAPLARVALLCGNRYIGLKEGRDAGLPPFPKIKSIGPINIAANSTRLVRTCRDMKMEVCGLLAQ